MKTFAAWSVLLILSAGFLLKAANSGVQGVVTLGGAAFPAVEVEASSSSLGQFWETSTSGSGQYVFDKLPPGRYTVWAEVTGHGCIVKSGVVVKDGSRSIQNFRFSKNKTYPRCASLRRKKNT
jgi:hypothetical protein